MTTRRRVLLPFSSRSLRIQALLWLVLPQLLMLLLGIGLISFAYDRVVTSLAESRNQELSVILAERVADNMLFFVNTLTSIASRDGMRTGDPLRQLEILAENRDRLNDFDGGVLVLDAEGFVSAAQPLRSDLLHKDFSDAPYFVSVKALASFHFSDIIREQDGGEEIIVVAVPILDHNEEFVGVIAGRFLVRYQRLGEEMRRLQVSERGSAYMYMVDRNGRAIYHPDEALLAADLDEQDDELISRLLKEEGEGPRVIVATLEDGKRWVIGFARVQPTGWGLVRLEPWDDVVAPLKELRLPIAIILIPSMMMIMVIVSLAVQRVTAPIADLASRIRQVATGDYGARVESSSIPEIRELTEEFNRMVDEISRYRAGLREYVGAITHTLEEERKRIARDLHDDTVQSLIAIGRQIEMTRELLDDPETAREQLTQLRQAITETIENVRQFSRDLRPLALEDLGLIPALQTLLNRLSQQDSIETHLAVEGEDEGLAADVEVAIYRVVQEALTNVRKHARASRVELRVEFLPNQVIATVTDDGEGFDVPEQTSDLARSGSFGLMGLQERAQLFGGQMFVRSSCGEGTTVRLVIPKRVSVSLLHNLPAAGDRKPRD